MRSDPLFLFAGLQSDAFNGAQGIYHLIYGRFSLFVILLSDSLLVFGLRLTTLSLPPHLIEQHRAIEETVIPVTTTMMAAATLALCRRAHRPILTRNESRWAVTASSASQC